MKIEAVFSTETPRIIVTCPEDGGSRFLRNNGNYLTRNCENKCSNFLHNFSNV
jgi:hypothetical protein